LLIDSHAHLDDRRFNKDRDQLIKNLEKDGIELVVNIGSNLQTSEDSVKLAEEYDPIYAVVGVHPHDAAEYDDKVEARLRELAGHKKVVAIGEIGLDYYRNLSPKETQIDVFKRQLELARELDMPIVIHSRDASQAVFDILRDFKTKNPQMDILIHCYSDSVELMREYIKLGCYIALGGTTTFKNSRVPKEVAKQVPLERLVLETDSPYLTPEPMRGKRNEPKYVDYVAQQIADLRDITKEEVALQTSFNTRKFYRIENE